jgi:hypothetical protein
MPRQRLQVFAEYRYGRRGVLTPGERFRARGGPVYVTDDGRKIPLGDRGVFVFRRYCVQGAAKWIEAYREDGGGVAILWVGKPVRSRISPNLRRKPYHVVGKVQDARAARHKH